MRKIPLSLIIDDPAPGVHVYYHHMPDHLTRDGRPLLAEIPNAFLDDFCAVIQTFGVKGKFSVVPMPACRGDITRGIDGMSPEALKDWIHTVRTRVMPNFDLCPEVLTHERAIDLTTGHALSVNEMQWAATQTRETLAPYIARALSMLQSVSLEPTGVTSPWSFGIEVEDEYAAAVARAFDETLDKKRAWYFLHCEQHRTDVVPRIAYDDGEHQVVSVSATFGDFFWETIDRNDNSPAYVRALADRVLSEDGESGELLAFLADGCCPVLLTHWQSLFSNGLRTGLRALELVAARIERNLGARVEWVTFTELMNRTIDQRSFG